MNIAQASLEELRYYFILAQDLGYTAAERRDAAQTKWRGCWGLRGDTADPKG